MLDVGEFNIDIDGVVYAYIRNCSDLCDAVLMTNFMYIAVVKYECQYVLRVDRIRNIYIADGLHKFDESTGEERLHLTGLWR